METETGIEVNIDWEAFDNDWEKSLPRAFVIYYITWVVKGIIISSYIVRCKKRVTTQVWKIA